MTILHTYAGGVLDRVSQHRRDDDYLQAAWRNPAARVAVFCRGQCLVAPPAPDGSMHAALLPVTAAPRDRPWALLGLAVGAAPVFALDLAEADPPPDGGAFAELRSAAQLLPPADAALFAYGRALLDWRRRARFCGLCGAGTLPEQAGHVTVCTACGTHWFPRTDPTVIMLVTHGERALLGHNARFPTRLMYSVLAGFVEPGESLEEAVAREVMEETGVIIGPARYHSSQPWPYPTNLMLGFHAEALSELITVDPVELLDAAWFSRAQLRDPSEHGFELPPPTSIARRMIEDWLAQPGHVA
jgi:NAD+ diphosphatase